MVRKSTKRKGEYFSLLHSQIQCLAKKVIMQICKNNFFIYGRRNGVIQHAT